MRKDKIEKLAIAAGLPSGWYRGPWFDDEARIHTGISPQLQKFVELIENETKKVRPHT